MYSNELFRLPLPTSVYHCLKFYILLNISYMYLSLILFKIYITKIRLDPGLCGVTTRILLQSLRECPPLTLRDPADALNGLGECPPL